MIILYLLLAIPVLIYGYLKWKLNYFNRLGIKHDEPHILFGNFNDNVNKKKSFLELIEDGYEKYKSHRYYGMYQFLTPTLMINDPDLIRDITVKNFNHFVDHQSNSQNDVDPMWSRNVFSMRGEHWHQMRGTLSPAFTGSKMRFMFPLIKEVAERFVKYVEDRDEEIVKVEMKDTFGRVTNDIIATSAFGISVDSLKDPKNEFYTVGRKSINFTGLKRLVFFLYGAAPTVCKIFGLKIFDDEITNFFRGIVKQTLSIREEKGVVRPDMIHLLMQAKAGTLKDDDNVKDESFMATKEYSEKSTEKINITDEDITAQALVFYFGGFDTVNTSIAFIIYELALNPDVQSRLYEENEEILDNFKGEISYESMNKMKYLDMVVSEAMRKWPVAVVFDRICTKEYTIEPKLPGEKAIHLKPGDYLWFPNVGIQRDANYYPDPMKFDPERFSNENKGKIHPFKYMPFGVGPRNCIGSRFALMEIKTLVVHLLRKFEYVPVKETQIPVIMDKNQLNIGAEGGMWLGLKRRNVK